MPTSPEARQLLAEADRRALGYYDGIDSRPVYPSPSAIAALQAFEQPLCVFRPTVTGCFGRS